MNHGGANGLVDLAASLSLVVVYEKKKEINLIRNLSSGEKSLLNFALSNPGKLVHDAERNGNQTETSFSRRIQWGMNQNQGFSAECNRQFDYLDRSVIVGGKRKKKHTENIPAMNAKQFLSLTQLAKELVVSVAKMG